MKFSWYIMALFFVISCNCISHGGNTQRNESISNTILISEQDSVVECVSKNSDYLPEIDSVVVTYWPSTDARWLIISYSNGIIRVSEYFSAFQEQFSNRVIIDTFLSYIDSFFITKSEKIEISRVKRDDQICTDYTTLSFEIFLKNKSVIKQTHQIGYEDYDVEYNPLFLAFYEFLDNLCMDSKKVENDISPRIH